MGVTVKNFEVVGATDTITKFRTVVGPFGFLRHGMLMKIRGIIILNL